MCGPTVLACVRACACGCVRVFVCPCVHVSVCACESVCVCALRVVIGVEFVEEVGLQLLPHGVDGVASAKPERPLVRSDRSF